jgi:hypothetical protein
MNPLEPENYADHRHETSDWHRSRLDLWIAFCQKFRVAEDSVPLFDCDEAGFVRTKEIGKPRPRKLLRAESQGRRWTITKMPPLSMTESFT